MNNSIKTFPVFQRGCLLPTPTREGCTFVFFPRAVHAVHVMCLGGSVVGDAMRPTSSPLSPFPPLSRRCFVSEGTGELYSLRWSFLGFGIRQRGCVWSNYAWVGSSLSPLCQRPTLFNPPSLPFFFLKRRKRKTRAANLGMLTSTGLLETG